MLWKLIKYDCRAMIRQFGLIWPAVLVISLVTRISMPVQVEADGTKVVTNANTIMVIGMIMLTVVIITMLVLTVVFAINRYNKSLLGDEGYLMNTLPVSTWQLVTSKVICGMVAIVVSILVTILALLNVASVGMSEIFKNPAFQAMLKAFGEQPGAWLQIVMLIIMVLITIAQELLLVYTSLSVGHLVSRCKTLVIGITYIVSTYLIALWKLHLPFHMVTMNQMAYSDELGTMVRLYGQESLDGMYVIDRVSSWSYLLFVIAIGAICFLVTNYILKKKLNLE